ncbi:GNAT family protein [Herbaspirillum seropedicae]|uniref:GNAT family N-acetyltransferase n=1 Tax=Herbaspirillum seropedicae TaxID=964 RepID=UPI0031E21B1F
MNQASSAVLTVLEGEKVRLRPFSLDDIGPSYIAWLNDPLVTRFSNQRFRRHDQASSEQYLRSFIGTPNHFVAIVDKQDDRLLGSLTAYIAPAHKTVDVGMMVGERSVWGQGIGQDAWNTLCNWLLNPQLGLRKLTAGTARPNIGMIRIMERSGMELEAVRREQEIIEEEAVDLLYYARFAARRMTP